MGHVFEKGDTYSEINAGIREGEHVFENAGIREGREIFGNAGIRERNTYSRMQVLGGRYYRRETSIQDGNMYSRWEAERQTFEKGIRIREGGRY